MITPTVKTGQPLLIGTKVGGKRFIFVRSTKYNVQSRKYEIRSTELGKYQRNKKQEARAKRQEPRDEKQDVRVRLDFFASVRLCEQ